MSSSQRVDHSSRAEDVRWLAETGECATGAARRLGISLGALEKWTRDHDRESWRRLVAREPLVPVDRREINRRNAEGRWAS